MYPNHKPLSSLTATELAVTAANCPALKHAFNWATLSVGLNKVVTDLIGDVTFVASLLAGADAYSFSPSSGALDLALTSGNWVNPGTKTCVIMSMHGDAASGQNFIVGYSAVGPAGDGLRVNRNLINAYDHSATATGSATAPASTDTGAMIAMRLTPGAAINSIIVDDSAALVNTQSTTTIPATIDQLGDLITFSTTSYWGELIMHFDNPPTDQALAEAMAFMRPHWLRGEFVLAPNMLGWS